jgi:hypothetical protein
MSPPDTLTVRGFAAAVHYEVTGRVKGSFPEGATVRAVLKTLRSQRLDEETVADAPVDSTGSYRLAFDRPARIPESSDTSLTVRLYSADGDLIAESSPVLSPPARVRIDVRPPRVREMPSEYALLEQRIAENLASGVPALDGADESVLEEVSEWIDVDADRLAMLQEARALASDTGLPAPAFYALRRNGMGDTLEDLLEVPLHELRTTLDEAAADGIIDSGSLGNIDALVPELGERIIGRAMRPDAQALRPGLGEVLAAADLPPDAVAQVLRRYQARTGTASDFWQSFTEAQGTAEGVDEEVGREVELAVRLSTIVGPDRPLLRKMHGLRREGRWQTVEDLSAFDFDEWCDLIGEVEAENLDAEELEGARGGDPRHAGGNLSERVHPAPPRGVARHQPRRACAARAGAEPRFPSRVDPGSARGRAGARRRTGNRRHREGD